MSLRSDKSFCGHKQLSAELAINSRFSLVESEHPVGNAGPPGSDESHTPEASVVLVGPLEDMLMSSIAERCVGTHLAIAKLVVATLCHIEINRSQPGHNPLALSIAEGTDLGVTAAAPLVDLASVKVHVGREKTGVSWHAWGSVASFLVWPTFVKGDHLLLWEVCDIVHRYFVSWGWRLHNNRCWGHNISLVSFQLWTSCAKTRIKTLDYHTIITINLNATYSTFM